MINHTLDQTPGSLNQISEGVFHLPSVPGISSGRREYVSMSGFANLYSLLPDRSRHNINLIQWHLQRLKNPLDLRKSLSTNLFSTHVSPGCSKYPETSPVLFSTSSILRMDFLTVPDPV